MACNGIDTADFLFKRVVFVDKTCPIYAATEESTPQVLTGCEDRVLTE